MFDHSPSVVTLNFFGMYSPLCSLRSDLKHPVIGKTCCVTCKLGLVNFVVVHLNGASQNDSISFSPTVKCHVTFNYIVITVPLNLHFK